MLLLARYTTSQDHGDLLPIKWSSKFYSGGKPTMLFIRGNEKVESKRTEKVVQYEY